MTNTECMYDMTNAFTYAQSVLMTKKLAPSTRDNWQRLIKYLDLEKYQMPFTESDVFSAVERYSNPRTRKGVILTLNSIFGTKAKSGKSLPLDLDLPTLPEVSPHFNQNKY